MQLGKAALHGINKRVFIMMWGVQVGVHVLFSPNVALMFKPKHMWQLPVVLLPKMGAIGQAGASTGGWPSVGLQTRHKMEMAVGASSYNAFFNMVWLALRRPHWCPHATFPRLQFIFWPAIWGWFINVSQIG